MSPRSSRGWKVWVEPSGDGRYRCRWRGKHGTGQQTFVLKPDAKDMRDSKRRDLELMDAGLPLPKKAPAAITLGQGVEEYLLYSKKEKAPRTYRNFDKPAVDGFRDALGAGRLLDSLTPSDIQAWKHRMAEGTTASMTFRSVATFLNYMVKMKRLAESPAKGLAKPQESGGGRALTDDELKALLQAAPEQLYRSGVFSMNTMLRIGEVVSFRKEWVSEIGGGLMGRLPWQMRKTRGKVKKDCVFPINPQAAAMMAPGKEGLAFPWQAVTLQHQMVKVKRKTGLPADITFHCFRHTGASRYLDQDGHMEDLLKSGLWKDPRSLLRYVHVNPVTLYKRFAAMKYPEVAPTWPLNAGSPRPLSENAGT